MSEHEILDIVEKATSMVEEGAKKRNNKLMSLITVGFISTIFTAGWVGSDWHTWRKETTISVYELQQWKQDFQYTANQKEMQRINQIKVK